MNTTTDHNTCSFDNNDEGDDNPGCCIRQYIELNEETYSDGQRNAVSLGCSGNIKYGCIKDLLPSQFDSKQMWYISMTRGDSPELGNIDDLDPKWYDSDQMWMISKGRGSNPRHGPIDDLDPSEYNFTEMWGISLERGIGGPIAIKESFFSRWYNILLHFLLSR